MKNYYKLILHVGVLLLPFFLSFGQEFTVTKSSVRNKNAWEEQSQNILRRVTFFEEKGFGFVFNYPKSSVFHHIDSWTKEIKTYKLTTKGGVYYEITMADNVDNRIAIVYISMPLSTTKSGEQVKNYLFQFEGESN